MWIRRVIFFFFFLIIRTSSARDGGGGEGGGEGGGALPDFFFSCSADHERDWPPCKVVFFGLATNALNVRNNNNNAPSIELANPSSKPHLEFCSNQTPLVCGCSNGLDTSIFCMNSYTTLVWLSKFF